MKIPFFCIILFLSTLISCGKITKKKVANTWKVESFEMIAFDSTATGSTEEQISFLPDKYVRQTKLNNTVDSIIKGSLEFNILVIKEDGTWGSNKEYFYKENPNYLYPTLIIEYESGTWSFLKKSRRGGFKKNERIIFTTLKRNFFKGSSFPLNLPEYTYLPGENTTIYSILESTNSKLKLEHKEENTIHYNNSTNDQAVKTKTITISLVPGLPS